MSKKIKTGLGKGLGALIPSVSINKQNYNLPKSDKPAPESGSIASIDIDLIGTNPYQPRHEFDPAALEDLKNSIIEHGVIQPITIRKVSNGYELISGERRLRASKLAGLTTIPAFIIDVETGAKSLQLALIENVQRENLNPIEIAHGYQRLIDECNLTQEQVSVKVGKERSTVTNALRLLRLPEKIQELLRAKHISQGHARAIVGLNDQEKMLKACKYVIDNDLSVRATEAFVKEFANKADTKKEVKTKTAIVSPETALILEDTSNRLRQLYATEVKISPKSKESGTIEFEFYSAEDLDRLVEIFDTLNSEK